jgi:hypothetical protein
MSSTFTVSVMHTSISNLYQGANFYSAISDGYTYIYMKLHFLATTNLDNFRQKLPEFNKFIVLT